MKRIRVIRVALSVAILLVTSVMVWLGHADDVARCQLTLNLAALSLGALLAWFAATLLVGRVYCSSVCPVGTLQDFAAWLDKRMHHHGKGNYHFTPSNDRIRYLTLLLVAVGLTAGDRYTIMAPRMLDPVQLFNTTVELGGAGGMLVYGLFGVILALIILVGILWLAWKGGGRTFCNTICPVGTVLGTMSRVSLYRLDINTDLCIGCNLCEKECKCQCINSVEHTIDVSRCVMCMNCAASCPADAIKFTTTQHRLSTPLMQPTA